MLVEKETLESDKELCKRRESDEVLEHSADVGAVIGVVIWSGQDVITATTGTSHWVSTAQLLHHIAPNTIPK